MRKRRTGVGLVVLVLFLVPVLIVGVTVYLVNRPPLSIRALPAEATDVRYHYAGNDFLPDFSVCLRAKMSRAGFEQYVKNLGLEEQYSPLRHDHLPISLSGCHGLPWWDPPDELAGAFFTHTVGEEYFEVAVYDGGYAYFRVFCW